MNLVQSTLDALKTADTNHHLNLSVTPLLIAANDAVPDYLVLDDALERGLVKIMETSDIGDVPELSLENLGDTAVLLVDGEELVGAKQNRALNLSILAPAGQTITIPVSCVEAGRWRHTSRSFTSKGRAMYARGRVRRFNQVTHSLRERGSRRSDQGAVWEDIATKSARMGSHSVTDEMGTMYDDHIDTLDDYTRTFRPLPGQTGAVFAINGQVRGLELFDFPQTFQQLMPKLVQSYALDAIEDRASHPDAAYNAPGQSPNVSPDPLADAAATGEFLEQLLNLQDYSRHEAVGEGEDIRFDGQGITGGVLAARDRVVHLCAFRDAPAPHARRRYLRASHRRR